MTAAVIALGVLQVVTWAHLSIKVHNAAEALGRHISRKVGK